MRVVLSTQARAYVRNEAIYLRRHSRQAALAFRNRIATALDHLAQFPEMGRDIQRLPVTGARRLVVGDYVLDYDVTPDAIQVLAIRHGRQIDVEPDADGDFDYEAGKG